MEIKLQFNDEQRSRNDAKIKLGDTATQALTRNDKLVQKDKAVAAKTQSDTVELTRLIVLKCGTVMLQNYTDDLDEPGRQLQLVREPDNKYDRWATKVCTLSGTMLGYLPAWKNQSVARLIDAGKNITVFVDEILDIPRPNPAHYSREDERLPLVLYMDVKLPKEVSE